MNFLTNANKPPSLKRMLEARIGGFRPARKLTRLHASSLTADDFCPRQKALMMKLKTDQPEEFIPSVLQMTFDEGEDRQSRVNNDWLSDSMVGDWQCQSCLRVKSFCKRPKGHQDCPHTEIVCNWAYQEVRFDHQDSALSGGLDGLVNVGKGLLLVMECKIIAQSLYTGLKAAMAEHALRTNLYLRLIRESTQEKKNLINTKFGSVIYFARSHGAKEATKKISSVKEFHVVRDDSKTDHLFAFAKQITGFQNGGDIPKKVCDNVICQKAKDCPVAIDCFSGDYD